MTHVVHVTMGKIRVRTGVDPPHIGAIEGTQVSIEAIEGRGVSIWNRGYPGVYSGIEGREVCIRESTHPGVYLSRGSSGVYLCMRWLVSVVLQALKEASKEQKLFVVLLVVLLGGNGLLGGLLLNEQQQVFNVSLE